MPLWVEIVLFLLDSGLTPPQHWGIGGEGTPCYCQVGAEVQAPTWSPLTLSRMLYQMVRRTRFPTWSSVAPV